MPDILLHPVVMYFTTVISAVVFTALAHNAFPWLFLHGRREERPRDVPR